MDDEQKVKSLSKTYDSDARNITMLKNQCRHSQLRELISLNAGKKIYKGKNYSIKL